MKQITLIGNITKDCRVVETATPFVAFSLAVNEKVKGIDTTSYFEVASSNVKIKDYLLKGKKVFVQGGFKLVACEHEGKSGTRINVSANIIELLSGKEATQSTAPTAQSVQSGEAPPDDDLPF